MRFIIAILLLVNLCVVCKAQGPSEKYLRLKISLENKSLQQLAALGVETDHGQYIPGKYFTSEYSQTEMEAIKAAGFDVEVLIPDLKRHYLDQLAAAPPAQPRNTVCAPHIPYQTPSNYVPGTMGGYFRYEEMLANLDQMSFLYPDLIKQKAPISTSIMTIEGRPIYYVKVSDNPLSDEAEPEVLYTAVHHAREPNSMSQMIFYLWYLLENYETDPEVKYLVDNTEMYFIPCINPDGYIYNETTDPEGGGFWRKNRRDNGDGTFGVDLNRNYGFNWGYDDGGSSPNTDSEVYRGTAPFSEPENQMVRDFCIAHEFQLAFNYHTFGDLLIHAWNYQAFDSPDEETFANFSHIAGRDNYYLYGNSSILYLVNGGSDDWMYGEQTSKPKILSMTPEVGSGEFGFWPPSWEIDHINKENVLQNLMGAHQVLNYGEATETNPFMMDSLAGNFNFSLKKYGLLDGTLTVSLTGLTPNIIQTGDPKSFDLATNASTVDFIGYTLDENIPYGAPIVFVLTVDNGLYQHRDTIQKLYGINEVISENNANTLSGWTANGGWILFNDSYHSAPASIAASCCDANGTMITTTQAIDLTGVDTGQMWLTYWVRWDTENDRDYAQVLISGDNSTFKPLCGKYTVEGNVQQSEGEPVYEGFQPVWIQEKIDISEYMGTHVKIRFYYEADGFNSIYSGFYFDDVAVTVLGDGPTVSVYTVTGDDFMISQNNPNPVSDFTAITAKGEKLEVYDALGRLYFTQILSGNNAQTLLVDVRDWMPGVYYYRVTRKDKMSEVLKLIKE